MGYRNYSDEDKATALAFLDACGGNAAEAARQANIPYMTMVKWRDGSVTQSLPSTELIDVQKERLETVFECITRNAAQQTLDKLNEANPLQAATIMAIATDKMQLLRSQPTQITVDRHELILRLAQELRGVDQQDAIEGTVVAPEAPVDAE